MNNRVIIEQIEVIQGGIFQIDIYRIPKISEEEKRERIFIEPADLFGMIGKAIQKNVGKWNAELINHFSGCKTKECE